MSHVLFILAVTACIISASSNHVMYKQYLIKPCDGQLVRTKQGLICGVERSSTLGLAPEYSHFSYIAYQGIPYAHPPLGHLRFKNPVAGLPWHGVRNGNWSVPECPQVDFLKFFSGNPDILGEEDCLYLNVYTPKISGSNITKLPVMVYIHGGGLFLGSASDQDPQFFMAKDVIVVLIQYRLGYLGLMSTEDDAAPGNLLLKDQVLALQWVQDNIECFGGDKDKVTLFGESAGALSAHLQMLNPKAKGLFSKVILQSGTALFKSFFQEDQREVTGLLAKRFGCVDKDPGVVYDSQQVVACLQKVAPKELVFALSQFAKWNQVPVRLGFRIDGEVLLDHPARLLKDGNYHMVDLMAGVNSHEGAIWIRSWYDQPNLFDDIAANFSSIGHWSQDLLPSENHVARELYNYYLGGVRRYTEEDADALVQLSGDLIFAIPNDISVQLHARDTLYGRNIFKYEFQHRGQHTVSLIGESDPNFGLDWVNHGDELQYLFKMKIAKSLERKEDLEMREIILDLWTNFAKHGNPTPDRSHGFTWRPVGLESQPHLALKLQSHMESDKRCQIRSFFHTLDLSVNRILYPGQFAAGKDWRPWRIQDTQNHCGT